MSTRAIAPYGTWQSPLTARTLAVAALRIGSVTIDGGEIYWIEGRAEEGGRTVLVRRNADGTIGDVVGPDANVRTRVHEYGGGAYLVHDRTVYYVELGDQRVYRLDADGRCTALTPAGSWRYADFAMDVVRRRIVCVREDHGGPGVVNTLVSLPIAGPAHAGEIIVEGDDFYATPRVSADGSRLSWLSWRHPQMPWDGSELFVGDLDPNGRVTRRTRVAGSARESVFQPGWSPDGTLYFVSDRTNWWNLYRRRGDGHVEPVLEEVAEFGRPQWQFGMTTWAALDRGGVLAAMNRGGRWELVLIDTETRRLTTLAEGLEPGESLAAVGWQAALVAGSPTTADAIVRVDLTTGAVDTLRTSVSIPLDPRDISTAEAIEYPTRDGATAHAFHYAPRNSAYAAPEGERPPLIVVGHGGPTAAARATLDPGVQFWTTRGFAVVDVNYSGSTGFGRAYRDRLKGEWGVADVADCVEAARFLAAAGKVDPERMAIRGGSAGGYTALAALTFHPGVFKAAASYYGISDIEGLARDTHKFESRYLDSLVGPYPAARETYRARSPINFVDRLTCPLILFQGLDDKVVPPNQAALMADALRAKNLPVALLTFEGEQHGFRKADTIVRCLESELYFYGRVFGFTPADPIAPVPIDNLTAAP